MIRDKDRKQGRVLHSDKTTVQECNSPICIYYHYFKAYRTKNNRTQKFDESTIVAGDYKTLHDDETHKEE